MFIEGFEMTEGARVAWDVAIIDARANIKLTVTYAHEQVEFVYSVEDAGNLQIALGQALQALGHGKKSTKRRGLCLRGKKQGKVLERKRK